VKVKGTHCKSDAWPVWWWTHSNVPSCRESLHFGKHQIILLDDRDVCEQLAQRRYVQWNSQQPNV